MSWYVYVTVDGKRTYVKKSGLVAMGLSSDLTYDEAAALVERLNAQSKHDYQAGRRLKIAERIETVRLESLAFQPALVAMGAVKFDPSEWAERPYVFYNYF